MSWIRNVTGADFKAPPSQTLADLGDLSSSDRVMTVLIDFSLFAAVLLCGVESFLKDIKYPFHYISTYMPITY